MAANPDNASSLKPSHRRNPVCTWASLALIGCLTLAGCATKPPPVAQAPVEPVRPVEKPPAVAQAPKIEHQGPVSQAQTPRDYRKDAASHLYSNNGAQIFAGKLPPLLYAVGVLQVDIDARGMVRDVRWMRAPKHAPEVMAEIERKIRLAAPFPAPVKMGHVTYTDTWLWHKSGRFQLDTLTEGQL